MRALWGLCHHSLCAHTDWAVWGSGSSHTPATPVILPVQVEGAGRVQGVPRSGLASGFKLGEEVMGGAGSPNLSAMSAGLVENIWQYLQRCYSQT